MDILAEKIFEALGIKPNERFKIKGDNSETLFLLDKNLNGYCVEEDNSLLPFNATFLQDILRGKIEIVKIKEPTEEDKIIIDYARLCGFNWIAVDEDGDTVASTGELKRDYNSWYAAEEDYEYLLGKLSFLSWEDEPYYIGE